MTRPILLAGALALAIPSLGLTAAAWAQPAPAPADPSNPASAPLSPSQEAVNQPGRGDDSRLVRDAEAEAATMSGSSAADAETEADRQAREEAARPKATRTVRMGERTMASSAVAEADATPRR